MAKVVAVKDASLHVYAGEGDGTITVVLHAGDSVDAKKVADYVLKDVKAGKASALQFVSDEAEAAQLAAEAAARYAGEASVEVVQPETAEVVQQVFVGDQVQQVETSLGLDAEGSPVFGSTGAKPEGSVPSAAD